MRRRLALSLILVCLSASVAHAETTSAEWQADACCAEFSATFGGPIGARWFAQTFLAEASGPVISATLRLRRFYEEDIPLRVALFRVDETDVPVGDPLYFEDFSTLGLDVGPWNTVVFTFSATTPILNSGHRYAIAATTPPESTLDSPFFMNGTADFVTPPYPGGRAAFLRDNDVTWTGQSTYDMVFRVVVDEIVSGDTVSFGSIKGTYRN